MNLVLDSLTVILLLAGLMFFISGSAGLIRFPDLHCRLHAVTKADTLGLGLVALGLACQANDIHTLVLLVSIWLLVMLSGAVTCQLLARYSLQMGSASAAEQEGRD